MADVDVEELKKLSPEQRLKALKALEEKSRKEIEEARKLMAESEREIEVEEEHRRDMPIPQLTSVDIDSLFSQEEKEMFKAKRFISEKRDAGEDGGKEGTLIEDAAAGQRRGVLEEVLGREKQPELGEQEAHQYGARLEMIRDRVYQLSDMTNQDPARFAKYETEYKEELEEMKKEFEEIHHKYKTAGDAVAQEATIGGQIDKLLGWYRR